MTKPELSQPDGHAPRVIVLSEAQIDAIATRVENRFYQRVGKKVIEKVLFVAGLAAVAVAAWLAGTGKLSK